MTVMKHTASYDVTPEMQYASVKQFFWSVLFRPRRAGIVTVVVAWLAMIVMDPPYKPWLVGFFTAAVLFLVVSWVRTYWLVLAQAKAGLRLIENPKVQISIDESQVEYVSATATYRHAWSKIERIEETKDFVIFMHGKFPLLSLPKSSFSSEELIFMKTQCGAGRPSR